MYRRSCSTLVSTVLVLTSLTMTLQPATAQYQLSNFTNGDYFPYGDFIATQGPTYYDVSAAQSNGGIEFTAYFNSPVNLTAYAMKPLYITARTLSGNQADLLIYLYTNARPSYGYYYAIPASDYNSVNLATGYSTALNDPSVVVDAANNYAVVGSGTAFAPDLSAVSSMGIQGSPYASTPLDFRFSDFGVSNVPEPGTFAMLASLGLTGAAFLRRKRTR